MKSRKAPRPDGFLAGFYQKNWELVEKNVCDFVQYVWRNPSAISDVNNIDICLIPKVNQPYLVSPTQQNKNTYILCVLFHFTIFGCFSIPFHLCK